ncbi:MAG: hypothetical protein RR712_04350 [Terrisporobacter sp.]
MINTKSEIINKLFFRELQHLMNKYNSMNEDTIIAIESVIEGVVDQELQQYLIDTPHKLNEIVNKANKGDSVETDAISFFAWYNQAITDIGIEDAIDKLEELQENKYLKIDEYLIHGDNKDLMQYAKEELGDMLDMEYHVDRLLDKEIVIDMWINGTTKEEIIEEIVDNSEIEEILELNPQYAFTTSKGYEYRYSQIEI